jgi:hypothetical protein
MSDRKLSAALDLATLEMFVLDVLRHDELEQVSSLVKMLNDRSCIGWRDHWPHDFTQEEVTAALNELVQQGKVEAMLENPKGEFVPAPKTRLKTSGSAAWFRLTPAGQAAWDQWEPPAEPA